MIVKVTNVSLNKNDNNGQFSNVTYQSIKIVIKY